jgi:hypothetical protein
MRGAIRENTVSVIPGNPRICSTDSKSPSSARFATIASAAVFETLRLFTSSFALALFTLPEPNSKVDGGLRPRSASPLTRGAAESEALVLSVKTRILGRREGLRRKRSEREFVARLLQRAPAVTPNSGESILNISDRPPKIGHRGHGLKLGEAREIGSRLEIGGGRKSRCCT